MSSTDAAPLLTRDEAAELVDLCVHNAVADPTRRSLLLAGITPSLATDLRTCDRPRDQLQADVDALVMLRTVEGMDAPPLLRWMANARRMVQAADDAARLDALRAAAAQRARRRERSVSARGAGGGRGRAWWVAVVLLVAVGVVVALAMSRRDEAPGGSDVAAEPSPAATEARPAAAPASPGAADVSVPRPILPPGTFGPAAAPAAGPMSAVASPPDTTIVETGNITVTDRARVRGGMRHGAGSTDVKTGDLTVRDDGALDLAITEGAGRGDTRQRVRTGGIDASGNAEVTLGEVK